MSFEDRVKLLFRSLRPVSEEADANAAVVLLLRIVDKEFNILFVERAKNLGDPWSGQIALPGGRRDSKDSSLKQTVVRETLEETNINLLDHCRFLGVLDALRSELKPEMNILPFVALLEHEPAIKLNKEELTGFFWVPMKKIQKGNVTLVSRNLPAYISGNVVIWGLTYKILEKFFQTLC